MKQNNIEKKAESQHREAINHEPAGSFNHLHEVKQKSIYKNDYLVGGDTQSPLPRRGRGEALTPPFGGAGGRPEDHCFGKAPPGRSRSPGAARGHPPDKWAEPPDQTHNIPAPSPLSTFREGSGVSQNIKIQTFNKKQNSNYYKHLISTKMKKQILILIVALFAVTSAFGQTLVPRTIGCAVTEGPLTPQLGKTYTYAVTIPNSAQFTGTVPLNYNWFVTKSKTFITSGAISATVLPSGAANDFVATGTYNSLAGTSNTIDISWNSTASLTDPFFLVVNVIGDNTVCTPENVKIYKIVPANLFTLDVANVTAAGAAQALDIPLTTCISDIQSISWIDTDALNAKYDYGSDYLYFAVAAANFSTSWNATVNITNDQGQGLITAVEWSRTYNGTFTAMTSGDADTWTATIPVNDASGTVGTAGETIIVRVTLDYTTATNFFEGILDQVVNFEVDGLTALGDPDLHWNSLDVADCGKTDGFKYDKLVHTVKQRPAANTNTLPVTQPFLVPIP